MLGWLLPKLSSCRINVSHTAVATAAGRRVAADPPAAGRSAGTAAQENRQTEETVVLLWQQTASPEHEAMLRLHASTRSECFVNEGIILTRVLVMTGDLFGLCGGELFSYELIHYSFFHSFIQLI